MAISLSTGLGSGIDIESMISQLVSAERTPTTKRLDALQAKFTTQISGLGTIKSALSGLQSTLADLKKTSTFQNLKATVADEKQFTATTDASSVAGNYNVLVNNLAQAQRLVTTVDPTLTSTTSQIGIGTLSIQVGSAAAKSITITDGSLAGVRDAINSAKAGVTANLVKDGSSYRLVVGANDTGAANGLTITVSGDSDSNDSDNAGLSRLTYNSAGTKNMTETAAARDAQIVVDGLTLSSASNTVKDIIPSVTLNLKAGGTTATSLTVAQDASGVTTTLQAFVKSYNDLMSNVKSLTAYNTTTKAGSALTGDSVVRSTVSQVRDVISSSVTEATGTYKTLADIGISMQRDGTLALDATKLQTALAADTDGVASVFSAGTTGIAQRLGSVLGNLLGSDGPLASRTDTLNRQIKDIGNQRDAFNLRMTALEERYRTQLSAMDQLVNKFNTTSSYLAAQLSGLSSN